MKIKGCELGDNVVTEIGKFTILWANFEKKYYNNDCSDKLIFQEKDNFRVKENLLVCFNNNLHGRMEYFDTDIEVYTNYNLIPENARRPKSKYVKIMKDFINLDV